MNVVKAIHMLTIHLCVLRPVGIPAIFLMFCGLTQAQVALGGTEQVTGPALNWRALSGDLPMLRSQWLADADRASVDCPQNLATVGVTLEQAIDFALCKSPKVRAAWLDVKVQRSAIEEARSAYFPSANVSASRAHQRTVTPSSDALFMAGGVEKLSIDSQYASVNWRVFDFGERQGNLQSAQSIYAAALASYHAALHDVRKNVIGAYFDVLTTKATWLMLQENEALNRESLAVLERRLQAGAASIPEVSRASATWASGALERSRAKGNHDKALVALGQFMGLPSKDTLLVMDVTDLENCRAQTLRADQREVCSQGLLYYGDEGQARQWAQAMSDALPDFLNNLRDVHPTLVSVRSQIQSYRDKAKSFLGQVLPRLDFSSNYYKNGSLQMGFSANNSTRVMSALTLTIPLSDGFATYHRREGVLNQAEKRAAELEDIQTEVLNDVVKQYSDLSAALANLESTISLTQAAKTAQESAERRVQRGEADVLEWLNIQMLKTNARQERLRALAEWHSARLKLLASLALIDKK